MTHDELVLNIQKQIAEAFSPPAKNSYRFSLTGGESTVYSCAGGEYTIDDDSIFFLGSISKIFMPLIFRSLLENAGLNWETKIGELLNDIRPPYKEITISNLLTHSSGLTDDFKLLKDNNKLEDLIVSMPNITEPGKSYVICQMGYYILAKIAELITEADYLVIFHKYIIEKLSLESTFLKIPESKFHCIVPSFDNEGNIIVNKGRPEFTYPVGGVVSSFGDLRRVLKEFARVLQDLPEVATKVKLNAQPKSRYDFVYECNIYQMGFGFRKLVANSMVLEQNGGVEGHFVGILFLPEKNLQSIFVSNFRTISECVNLDRNLRNIICKNYGVDFQEIIYDRKFAQGDFNASKPRCLKAIKNVNSPNQADFAVIRYSGNPSLIGIKSKASEQEEVYHSTNIVGIYTNANFSEFVQIYEGFKDEQAHIRYKDNLYRLVE